MLTPPRLMQLLKCEWARTQSKETGRTYLLPILRTRPGISHKERIKLQHKLRKNMCPTHQGSGLNGRAPSFVQEKESEPCWAEACPLCHGSYSFPWLGAGCGRRGVTLMVGYYFLRRFMEIENIVHQVIFLLFATTMENIFSLAGLVRVRSWNETQRNKWLPHATMKRCTLQIRLRSSRRDE